MCERPTGTSYCLSAPPPSKDGRIDQEGGGSFLFKGAAKFTRHRIIFSKLPRIPLRFSSLKDKDKTLWGQMLAIFVGGDVDR